MGSLSAFAAASAAFRSWYAASVSTDIKCFTCIFICFKQSTFLPGMKQTLSQTVYFVCGVHTVQQFGLSNLLLLLHLERERRRQQIILITISCTLFIAPRTAAVFGRSTTCSLCLKPRDFKTPTCVSLVPAKLRRKVMKSVRMGASMVIAIWLQKFVGLYDWYQNLIDVINLMGSRNDQNNLL